MQYEIVDLAEKRVVGLLKKTTNQNMQAVADIGFMWQEFISKEVYASISNKVDQKAIGLYTDYEGDCTKPYNFVCCCEVNSSENIKIPLVMKIIPAGRYAKFSTRGHVQQAVGELWQKIWEMDLERGYSSDFEVYYNNSEDMNDQIIDIYVSLM